MLRRYFTQEEQLRLLREPARHADVLARRDAAWIEALLLSGLRITEFSLTTLGDAGDAIRTKYLFIPKERRKGGKHDHRVFVTARLRTVLKKLVEIHYEMIGSDESMADAPLVLSRQHGGSAGMTVRSFQLRFKRWAADAGLPADASPHWLRHSRAMNIMRDSQAADPRGVTQAALGHASIASTGIYTKVSREDLEQALAATDAQRGKRVTLTAMRKEFDKRSAA